MSRSFLGCAFLLSATIAAGQDPQSLLQSLKEMAAPGLGAASGLGGDVLPGKTAPNVQDTALLSQKQAAEADRAWEELRALKAREKGPRRYAADLFEIRNRGDVGTDGGISEEYVLGAGDRLNISAFGSAAFDVVAQVDGRGMVIVPKLGTVKVGGSNLGQARQSIQGLVRRQFSNTTVDIQAIRLREVRVFVMGEVYKAGSYVVSSQSSLVNVLSLAGGPNASGSYRQIKVIRGGKPVHVLDLYPYRSEGLGNMNFYLENGDTIFVPLAANQVLLEGAFSRVTAGAAQPEAPKDGYLDEPRTQRDLRREIQRLEEQLQAMDREAAETPSASVPAGLPVKELKGVEARKALLDRLDASRDRYQRLLLTSRGDRRVPDPEAPADETIGQPGWLARWQREGVAPSMQFEMLPGETAADALRFAGGFDVQGLAGRLTLRRIDGDGSWRGIDVALGSGAVGPELQRGDVLTALPRRDGFTRTVQVAGWARVPGSFSRTEGLRVADLLKRDGQVLPDTYLGRGEITRRLPDGSTRYLAFDLGKALAGDAAHNPLLEDQDRIDLYRTSDMKLPRTLTVVGPVTRPGTFDYHEGMRASDLLFRAGIPLRNADRFTAELSHVREGKVYEVRRLDLAKLLSGEGGSPVDLKDDAVNPRLEPYDQLSVFAKPDYRAVRSITLTGQVHRPGQYTLDSTATTLKEIVERAGGLTAEAMPEAAVFLRRMWQADPNKARAAELAGVSLMDPTSNGIDQTLQRLNETLRNPLSGAIQDNPLLHGLQTGSLSRLIVNIPALVSGEGHVELELQDGDEVIFPTRTSVAYVVGETASPFAAYKVDGSMRVGELLKLAGGITRNADRGSIRLLKANGQIVDSWVSWQKVSPGDTVLVPQRIRRDSRWQENLQALTPLALILNAIHR